MLKVDCVPDTTSALRPARCDRKEESETVFFITMIQLSGITSAALVAVKIEATGAPATKPAAASRSVIVFDSMMKVWRKSLQS